MQTFRVRDRLIVGRGHHGDECDALIGSSLPTSAKDGKDFFRTTGQLDFWSGPLLFQEAWECRSFSGELWILQILLNLALLKHQILNILIYD